MYVTREDYLFQRHFYLGMRKSSMEGYIQTVFHRPTSATSSHSLARMEEPLWGQNRVTMAAAGRAGTSLSRKNTREYRRPIVLAIHRQTKCVEAI